MGGRSWYAHCGNDDEWDLWRRQKHLPRQGVGGFSEISTMILSSGWRGRVRRLAINDTTCLRWNEGFRQRKKDFSVKTSWSWEGQRQT